MIDNQIVEIRWHGRGGQGAVTSSELVAKAAIDEGKYAQAFPSFGPERRGAPVLSFNRIRNDRPIRNRTGITEPDIVVVLDPSLIHIANVSSGLKEGGTLIVNTAKNEDIIAKFGSKWRIATIDATRIAREILGVPITNTTMIGAMVKATGLIDIKSFKEPTRERFGRLAERNIDAMNRAYREVLVKELV